MALLPKLATSWKIRHHPPRRHALTCLAISNPSVGGCSSKPGWILFSKAAGWAGRTLPLRTLSTCTDPSFPAPSPANYSSDVPLLVGPPLGPLTKEMVGIPQ